MTKFKIILTDDNIYEHERKVNIELMKDGWKIISSETAICQGIEVLRIIHTTHLILHE